MSVTTGLFYVFSVVLLFAAFRVITARNPVHAALFLVLTFFQAAMVWMLLKAEFLSITLVLVYVGAVMVLFLFVVMMMDINVENLRVGFWKHFPFAALVGVVIALEMAAVVMGGFRVVGEPQVALATGDSTIATVSNTRDLGALLFSQYLFPLEVAAAILLVAVIAAIALTLVARKDSKYVDPSVQVRVKSRDRMKVLKMASTQAAPDSAPLISQAETKV
jgi:NADH-quinone oxidoreductase subunit J